MKHNLIYTPQNSLSVYLYQLFICFLLLSLPYNKVSAYNDIQILIDSLEEKISIEHNSKDKVDLLVELSYQYLKVHPDSSKKYAEQALILAQDTNYPLGIAGAEARLGGYYRRVGRLDQAKRHYTNCLHIREKHDKPEGIANMHHNIANVYAQKGQLDSAIYMLEKALSVYEQDKTLDADRAGTMNTIAEVYTIMGDFKQALQYCMDGLEIRERLNNPEDLANSLLNLGGIYTNLNKFDNALEEYQRALSYFETAGIVRGQIKVNLNMGINYSKIGKYPESLAAFEKGTALIETSGFRDDLFSFRLNQGILHSRMEEYEKARNLLLEAKEIALQSGNQMDLCLSFENLGSVEFGLGNFQQSRNYFQKSKDMLTNYEPGLLHCNIYEGLAETYSELEQLDSANKYFRLTNQVRDTLFNKDRESLELEKQLRIENAIQKERLENQLEISEVKRSRQMLAILGLILIIAILGIYFYQISRANKEKQELKVSSLESQMAFEREKAAKDKQQADYEKKINDLRINSAKALLDKEEEERERIAQEIHDNLGSLLSKIQWNIDSLQELSDATNKTEEKEVEGLTNLIEETIQEVRNISRNMGSGNLRKFGLQTALENLIGAYDKKNIEFKMITHKSEGRFDPIIELNLFRIAQEAIGNALKYADATEITIQLIRHEEGLNMLVEDNGIGFDLSAAEQSQGIGLTNMRQRAILINGKFDIDTSLHSGSGTTINIDVPIE